MTTLFFQKNQRRLVFCLAGLISAIFTLVFVFSFQNCALQGLDVVNIDSIRKTVKGSKIANCTQTAEACIFFKSPYYQKNIMEKLENTPMAPVRIERLDESGLLKNKTFEVVATHPVQKIEGVWTMTNEEDALAQFSAYFYAQNFFDFVESRLPKNPLVGLKIVINSTSSGWEPTTNSVFLGKTVSGTNLALDGSLITHFVAQAYIGS